MNWLVIGSLSENDTRPVGLAPYYQFLTKQFSVTVFLLTFIFLCENAEKVETVVEALYGYY